MKLIEAFDQIKTDQHLPDTSVDSEDVSGRGKFSAVKGDQDPHMINKVAHRHDPAYNAYVDFLIDNKLAQSNPHFPRIYTSEGNDKWKTEKLQYTLRQYLYDKNTDPKELDQRLETLASIYLNDKEYESDITPNSFYRLITQPSKIKLGTYRRALEIINQLFDKLRHDDPRAYLIIDLHPDNIMVRMSPVGPQLVLVDPFADMMA